MPTGLALALALAAVAGVAAGLAFSRGLPSLLRSARLLARAPFPVWTEEDGRVTWMNRRARQLLGKRFRGRASLKTRPLHRASDVMVAEVPEGSGTRPLTVLAQTQGRRTAFWAQDARPLVETEEELHRIVQTLAATFAHIPIGLAIFDRRRNLTIFNPALSDLLGISPEWLARRPSLAEFLDHLRNDGALPEPRNYSSLKNQFEELETGAFKGKYEVEWVFPNGRLYRVTGRPHAEGGAALLFEDISRYASIEARYQSEIRKLQGTLDVLSDALAVFDAAGEMTFANDAFDALWGCELSRSAAPVSVTEVSAMLQERCDPSPLFGEMRDFVLSLEGRAEWEGVVFRKGSGTPVRLRFLPITEGRVVCEFRALDSDRQARPLASSA